MNANQGFIPPPAPNQPAQAPYAPAPTQQMNVAPPAQGFISPPQPAQPVQPQQPQYYQPAPQQPVQSQQPQQPQYPTFPSVAPGVNPTGVAPQLMQPQMQPAPQAPQGSVFQPIYDEVARDLNISVQEVAAAFADDPRRFAQVIRSVRDQAQGATQPPPAPAQTQQAQPVEIPQVAYQYMKRNDNGLWEATVNHPQAQQWAQAQNDRMFQEALRAQQISADPTSIFRDPAVAKMIGDVVDQRVKAETQQRELESLRATYRDKYAAAIIAKNPQTGQDLQDFNGDPRLNPLGEAFNKHAKALHARGLGESQELYETAMMLAERETGMSASPQQFQQQPQLPFQPLNGQYAPRNNGAMQPWAPQMQPQQMQQPQAGYPMMQPAYVNGRQTTMTRVNSNGMAAQPGMAPARMPQPIHNRMSFRNQLELATQGMNPNEGMEYYWNNLFSR